MRTIVVYYSHSGNNKLLAEHIAGRLGTEPVAAIPTGKRNWLSILFDLGFKRKPRIRELEIPPGGFDHVLFVAPVWDMWIGRPLVSAILRLRDSLQGYSFVTFCGYERPGQAEHIEGELLKLTGRKPSHVWELVIGELYPPEDRHDVKLVSRHRVTADELETFREQIDAIAAALTDRAAPPAGQS